eukprot:SM000156S02135  [mRNA]  locus=s156:148152:155738:+ [translate_table: standard]
MPASAPRRRAPPSGPRIGRSWPMGPPCVPPAASAPRWDCPQVDRDLSWPPAPPLLRAQERDTALTDRDTLRAGGSGAGAAVPVPPSFPSKIPSLMEGGNTSRCWEDDEASPTVAAAKPISPPCLQICRAGLNTVK